MLGCSSSLSLLLFSLCVTSKPSFIHIFIHRMKTDASSVSLFCFFPPPVSLFSATCSLWIMNLSLVGDCLANHGPPSCVRLLGFYISAAFLHRCKVQGVVSTNEWTWFVQTQTLTSKAAVRAQPSMTSTKHTLRTTGYTGDASTCRTSPPISLWSPSDFLPSLNF